MDLEKTSMIDLENTAPVMNLESLILLLLSVVMGAIVTIVVLPGWLPGLAVSISGEAPKAFWYLSRASAFIAFTLLWFSMGLGLIISNKMARLWPGGPVAFDLHQYTSLLGLAFALFHGLILMGDTYIQYTVAQVLVPFASVNYRPLWVGLGQIGFYVWVIVALSFYVRSHIGSRTWRLLHFMSFSMFGMAMVHGIFSGTDSADVWAARIYWYAGGSLMFLLLYRILANPKLPFAKWYSKPTGVEPAATPGAGK